MVRSTLKVSGARYTYEKACPCMHGTVLVLFLRF
nr:MAG TPA: hypothetical protein [Caudoviricetes sp.]